MFHISCQRYLSTDKALEYIFYDLQLCLYWSQDHVGKSLLV